MVAQRSYDVVVAGLGGMGSAAAAHLARRGMRVLGIEQFAEGHDLGASTGRSRMIRKAYFEDPAYVPLLMRAYDLWRELERETGFDIMQLTGVLMVGLSASPALTGARRSANLYGIAMEDLSASDVAARFPMTRMRAGEIALLEPEAGFIRPERAIEAHLTIARAHGAELQFATALETWAASGSGIDAVLGDGSHVHADKLVLCIGPWFAEHASDLGIRVTIQRNVQAWFHSSDPALQLGRLPSFFVDRDDYPECLYGFPDMGDGVKVAFHGFGEETAPAALRRDVSAAELETLRRALADWLPAAAGGALSAKVCMYSLTPDQHFVIAPHPEIANVVVAGGFSGHGYKFCSVVGEIIGDLAERGTSRHDIAFLSPQRFADQRERD